MKKFLIILLSVILVSFNFQPVAADEYNLCDIFNIKFLTGYSDQDDSLRVTRFINKTTHKDGFCLQPDLAYAPVYYSYERKLCEDTEVYQIVKVYEQNSDKSDEDYIATQLLIWKHLTGMDYTFDGKGINDYLHYSNISTVSENSNDVYLTYDIDLNKENNYSDISTENADIKSKDINIISGETLTVKEENENIAKAEVSITYNYDKQNAVYYESDYSQNIYSFEGDYKNNKNIFINFSINPSTTSVLFHKYDLNGNYIEGAEFTVYKEDMSGQEVFFLQKNQLLNLKDILLKENESNYTIELSERFSQYFDGTHLLAKEIGYFDYKIYNQDSIVRTGRAYVSDDTSLTNNSFKKVNLSIVNTGMSISGISEVKDVPINEEYYLCESEPAKGYEYVSEPCKLISTDTQHRNDIHDFYNDTRTFTLRLIKENSDKNITLDGAKFKISYNDDSDTKEIYFTTGALNISNPEKNKYLHYSYQDNNYTVDTFNDDYIQNNMTPGTYFYYFSNDVETDSSRLLENHTYVVDGGYTIEEIPYNSLITVEEIQAPEGYYISQSQYTIMADIPYSEITFKNYRVNEAIVLPSKKRKMVKTCVDD